MVAIASAGQPLQRLILVALLLAVLVTVLFMMRRGWLSRARRQAQFPPLLGVTQELGARTTADGLSGRYLGTTRHRNWLDRVVVHDLGVPSRVSILASPQGVCLLRPASSSFVIPASDVSAVRLDCAAAGKAYEPGGVVVVTWTLGEEMLDTAFRLDDAAKHPDAVNDITGFCETSHGVSQ